MKLICPNDSMLLNSKKCEECRMCNMPFELLDAMCREQEDKTLVDNIRVTDICQCVRKTFFEKKNEQIVTPEEYWNRFSGTLFHSGLGRIRKVKEPDMLELIYKGVKLTGTPDVIIGKRLIDTKKNFSFGEPYVPMNYIRQLNFYRYMLVKSGKEIDEIEISFLRTYKPVRIPCQILTDEIVEQCFDKYLLGLHNAIKNDIAPDESIIQTNTEYDHKYCQYKKDCPKKNCKDCKQ